MPTNAGAAEDPCSIVTRPCNTGSKPWRLCGFFDVLRGGTWLLNGLPAQGGTHGLLPAPTLPALANAGKRQDTRWVLAMLPRLRRIARGSGPGLRPLLTPARQGGLLIAGRDE